MTVGRTGGAIERMIGQVQFDHAATQFLELRRIGAHLHAGRRLRRARGRIATAALDFDQAEPAGAEGFQRVGGAELRNARARNCGGTHDRRALGYRDGLAINLERHLTGRG